MMENDLFNNAEQKLEIEEKKEELKREREAMLREAVSKYQDAAMEGDPRAQYALAHASFQAQDYVTSLSWWNQAAKKGLTYAWTRVALQYAYGLGVDKDPAKAMDCLWNAIHGDPEDMNALAYLGMFYEQGIGVEKNQEQAITCYRQAAENGDPMAQFALGMCYFFGNGLDESTKQALKWVDAAAEQNWPEALYFLGLQHYLGNRVDRDLYLSVSYLRRAAENGSVDAEQLVELVEHDINVEKQMREVNGLNGMLDQFEAYLNSFEDYDDDDEY